MNQLQCVIHGYSEIIQTFLSFSNMKMLRLCDLDYDWITRWMTFRENYEWMTQWLGEIENVVWRAGCSLASWPPTNASDGFHIWILEFIHLSRLYILTWDGLRHYNIFYKSETSKWITKVCNTEMFTATRIPCRMNAVKWNK